MNLDRQIHREHGRLITRRWFFRDCGVGLGGIALTNLLTQTLGLAATERARRRIRWRRASRTSRPGPSA